ncbi:MAG TPA: NTP transferase domain-containing protein [Pirellulales bacterium]|nr:NTP transferase domain-containing protein [Pirellulales bacterium]
MRTLIIPCGGRGSRMASFYFPKCLLPIRQRPLLFRIIQSWQGIVDEVVLVHNPRNERILRKYISTYYDGGLPIRFVMQPRPSGTFDAVRLGLEAARSPRVILNWSDVWLHKTPEVAHDDAKNIVVTSDIADHCRWVFCDRQFRCREGRPFAERHGAQRAPRSLQSGCAAGTERTPHSNGVLGIFLLNDLEHAFRSNFQVESIGETEVLAAFRGDSFRGVTVEDFTDIGDHTRYRHEDRLAARDLSTRAFGSRATIQLQESVVIKDFSDVQMHENEADWYRAAEFSFLPRVHSTKPLVLERLDAEPCWMRLERDPSPAAERQIVKRLSALARTIHTSRPSLPANADACQRQYLVKTLERLDRVDFLFEDFNRNCFTVNGREYPNPRDLLERNADAVRAVFPERFHFIHGDLQLSNALIDRNDRLYLIDPRGSFGGTPLFGDALYDFAKLYYGFCGGYDTFSTGRNRFALAEDGGFVVPPLLPPNVLARRRRFFERESRSTHYLGRSMIEIDIVHAIIWLSVADYVANDVLSSMYAYLNGTVLLSEALAARTSQLQSHGAALRAAA